MAPVPKVRVEAVVVEEAAAVAADSRTARKVVVMVAEKADREDIKN